MDPLAVSTPETSRHGMRTSLAPGMRKRIPVRRKFEPWLAGVRAPIQHVGQPRRSGHDQNGRREKMHRLYALGERKRHQPEKAEKKGERHMRGKESIRPINPRFLQVRRFAAV